uniref:Small ribosomal subunit protein uS3c n=1 Tax=Monsonia marlothii TaxID=163685 RepID=A0A142G6I5_9ROSI|nr:ribosomal protein S3 [Monsonia marlothii]AMQ99483.1 ribosomal protein S3 [Monsonia marlothii]
MARKINPLGFRLGTTEKHHSVWFEQPKNYCKGLQEDKRIRDCIKNYIDNRRKKSEPMKNLITRIQIEKHIEKQIHLTTVIIFMGFQELFEEKPTKRGKKEDELRHIKELSELKVNVEKALDPNLRRNRELKVVIRNILNPFVDPNILAELLAHLLKKRIPFRKAMKRVIELAKKAHTKGVKVQIAGRIDGRDIARVECLLQGRIPLHTIRAKIDFCSTRVQMRYGVLGIKIWIFSDTDRQFEK